MFPMPAARRDRPPEDPPSVLPRPSLADRASARANLITGGVLLLVVGALATAYSLQIGGVW
jgi:hypothetical protein